MSRDLTKEQWSAIVSEVLSAQPDLAATTVTAMQEGILLAQDRQLERLANVSMGLAEALRTKPGYVKRQHDLIIKAIEDSTLMTSPWSYGAIAQERTLRAQKEGKP